MTGIASVMGLAKRHEIWTTLKSSKWRRRHHMKNDASFEECVTAALDYHVEPAYENFVKKILSSNNALMKAMDKIIDDIPEDPTSKRLDEAEMLYVQQITEVDNALEEIRKMDESIECLSRSTIAITDAAQRANGLTELTDAQSSKIKAISMLEDQQKKAKTTQEGKIFKLFDARLGGIKTSGKDEKDLGLKEDMEKNTPKEIMDALSMWIKPRCAKYYTCLPAILRLLKSYDSGTGMYWCPHDTNLDMAPHTRVTYQQQAEAMHIELRDEIGDTNMDIIMATQMCGKEANQSVKGIENDGVSTMFCMLSKYGKGESTDRDNVEKQFIEAAEYFKIGRPINKVNYLRPLTKDLIRQGVKLKVSQTVEPIIRALQPRHSDFLLGLQGYAKQPEDPDNCTHFMEILFAQIEMITKKIERDEDEGESCWGRHTEANEARFQTPPNKKPRHHERRQGDTKPSQWQDRSKGGKGGKGGNSGKGGNGGKGGKGGSGKHRCKAKGCTDTAPPNKNFCTTCWVKGMQEGQLTAFDGEVYKVKDYAKTANKNKTQRANRAEKKQKSAKEVKDLKKENKKLQAALAKGRVPQVEDKRGTGDEIDAEHTQLYRAKTTPNKVRFGKGEPQRAGTAFGVTLEEGLGFNWNRLGETRSHRDDKLKAYCQSNRNNKRLREQPIEEDEGGESDEWAYAEDGQDIDAQAADVGYSSMDEDQDVFAHSA
jgi:uncharacterized membrane protein YgcG